MYPSSAAGSQLDLNHLWQQVQELSALLAANRESVVGIVRRADEIRHRSEASDDPADIFKAVNGHVNGDHSRLVDEVADLKAQLAESRADNEDLNGLILDYETVLERVLDGLRVYAHDHSIATINVHSSYTKQLANERAQNAALRQREIEDKARLETLSRLLREAFANETELQRDVLVESLRAENSALREALGLEIEKTD